MLGQQRLNASQKQLPTLFELLHVSGGICAQRMVKRIFVLTEHGGNRIHVTLYTRKFGARRSQFLGRRKRKDLTHSSEPVHGQTIPRMPQQVDLNEFSVARNKTMIHVLRDHLYVGQRVAIDRKQIGVLAVAVFRGVIGIKASGR